MDATFHRAGNSGGGGDDGDDGGGAGGGGGGSGSGCGCGGVGGGCGSEAGAMCGEGKQAPDGATCLEVTAHCMPSCAPCLLSGRLNLAQSRPIR